MNREAATQFINNLFTEVWSKLDANRLPDFYHQDVVLQMNKQIASYKDIQHRLDYVKSNYQTVTNNIQDILVDGNKITVRLEQICRTHNNQEHTYTIIAVYQIENNKVKRGWACIDPNINYFE